MYLVVEQKTKKEQNKIKSHTKSSFRIENHSLIIVGILSIEDQAYRFERKEGERNGK